MTELRLRLELPSPTPVDECLLGTVWLEAGSQPVTVNARLNLLEGDLTVTVTRPDQSTRTAGWPWPADSGARSVPLQPGERLVAGLVLLATAASQPVVDQPGRYVVRASYPAARGVEVESEPVTVLRSPPDDPTQASALTDRDVIQSLLSVSVMGEVGSRIDGIARGGKPVARMLSRLASGTAGPDAGSDLGDRQLAAAVTAVLPPGLFPADERAAPLLAASDVSDPVALAVLHGQPART
jgi:hypothetical protein